MNRQTRVFSSWFVAFCFLFATLSPTDALGFDTDTLKTTGIIMGITFGVALVVVLVVGTMRDMKRDKDQDDDEVWSRSPVLRALGYKPLDFPLLGPVPGAIKDQAAKDLVSQNRIDLSMAGKADRTGFHSPSYRFTREPRRFTPGSVPGDLSLPNPPPTQKRRWTPFSPQQTEDRS